MYNSDKNLLPTKHIQVANKHRLTKVQIWYFTKTFTISERNVAISVSSIIHQIVNIWEHKQHFKDTNCLYFFKTKQKYSIILLSIVDRILGWLSSGL
jgi:hypothetical protein